MVKKKTQPLRVMHQAMKMKMLTEIHWKADDIFDLVNSSDIQQEKREQIKDLLAEIKENGTNITHL